MLARLIPCCGLLAVLVGAASLLGCAERPICKGAPKHYVVLAFTSKSDLELSRELAPRVSRKVAARAAKSCGSVGAGVVAGKPAKDLEIRWVDLRSKDKTAPNPTPWRQERREKADRLLEKRMLGPLREAGPTRGSPFLGALAQTAHEVEAHRRPVGSVVLIGDSIARERTPSGRLVNFRREVPAGLLEEFVEPLRGLREHCVIIVGQGGARTVPTVDVLRAREMLRRTLADAGVDFVATRSSDLPPCSTPSVTTSRRGAP